MFFPLRNRIPIVFASSAILLAAGCRNGDVAAKAPSGDMPPMSVPIVVAQPKSVDSSSEYLATLKSRSSSSINPQVEGQITQIYVKSGDRVKAGSPLLQIDPIKQEATAGSQEATRAAKEAGLRLAQEQLERTRQLYAAGVVSKQALDEAQSAHDASQAELKALDAQVQEQRVQLRYYRIVAPTDGIVGDIPVHVGDRVGLSTLLTTVSQTIDLEAYIDVPIDRSQDLALGKPVQIITDDGSVMIVSRITFVSPKVNDATQTILIKASLDNSRGTLRNEQLVRARVVWGSRMAVLIPVVAISRINGQSFAFVAEKGDKTLVAHQRQVRLGEMVGNDYVVLEGISSGDRIITGSTQMLGDGTPVKPQ